MINLAFRQSRRNLLISGGLDGLICSTDIEVAAADQSEDNAVESIVNLGTALQSLGFYSDQILWAITGLLGFFSSSFACFYLGTYFNR